MNNNFLLITLICLISSLVITIIIIIIEKTSKLFCPKCYKSKVYVIECKEIESDSLDIKTIKRLKNTYTYKCSNCGHIWTQKKR